ncbi:MAG: fumarate hydratase [Thermodesulfobacteriota bacterium]|nr:fumarate hydratase [Thermodesulfobacteriota bacterium]
MRELYVNRETVYDMMYNSIVMAVTLMPSDVKNTLLEYLEKEQYETARLHLETIIKNCELAEKEGRLICPDTGSPLFYVRAGDNVRIEGGFSTLYEVSKNAIKKATTNARLRPNMVHPITRENPGTNVGYYLPKVEIRFDPQIDFLDIIAIPKGGGSEIFGTFYRMMYPADGKKGIMKFILDCIKESTYAGKTCPPNVIGIGIGGTADVCMKIAKEAAVLRPIGSRHPDKEISSLEEELVQMVKDSGIGPMGMGGGSGILDVHIEYAVTHTAGLPVAFNAQCSLSRRKVARFTLDNQITYSDFPEWNYR